MTILYKLIFFFFVLTFSCAPRRDLSLEDVAMLGDVVMPEKPRDVVQPEGYRAADTVYITTSPTETLTIMKENPTLVEKLLHNKKFTVQIGAFKNKNNAINVYEKLKNTYSDIYIIATPQYWKVRIGGYYNKEEAINAKEKLKKEGYKDTFIVSL